MSRAHALSSYGSQDLGSIFVVHGLSCPLLCGIFPDQESNLSLLHWQADSLAMSYQGSLTYLFFEYLFIWLHRDLHCCAQDL